MAHLFNNLGRFAEQMQRLYRSLGVHSTIEFICQSCVSPRLDPTRICALLDKPLRLQPRLE